MRKTIPLFFLLLLLIVPAVLAQEGFTYLLPAGDTLYQGESLEVDYMTPQKGWLNVRLLTERGETASKWKIQCKPDVPRLFRLEGGEGKKALAPGRYALVFSLSDLKDSEERIEVTVLPKRQLLPVLPTEPGGFLPADNSPAAILKALYAPIAVADVGALAHQKLTAAPGGGKAVGQVHGQTQALNVLRIEGEYAYVGAFTHEDGAYVEGYVPLKKIKMVEPNTRFGLVADKNAQTMTVYEDGEAIAELPISTGLMAKDKLFRETHAGAFVLEARVPAFSQGGFTYDSCIRYSGGNLLHGVGFQLKNGQRDESEQEALLGQKASHGCIRVGESENINADWLWRNLPRNTKLLILDDKAAREAALADILSGAGVKRNGATSTPAARLPQKAALPPVSTEIRLTFGGDCVLGSDRPDHKKPQSFGSVIAEKGMLWPMQHLRPAFAEDDLTLVNLEVVLQQDEKGFKKRQHNFRGDPSYTAILTSSSVEAVNVANNHHIDYTLSGKKSTIAALESAGIRYSGYGHLDVYEKDGVKIGFAGIRETTFRQNPGQMEEDIAALMARGCHYIIYSAHFGKEYDAKHNALQTRIARRAIDLGADMVVGTHTHVVQGVEYYRGKPIFYGLGNLVFGGNLNMTEFDATLIQAMLTVQNGVLQPVTWSLLPVITSGARPQNDFSPIPAQGEDRARIIRKIQADTPFKVGEINTVPMQEAVP